MHAATTINATTGLQPAGATIAFDRFRVMLRIAGELALTREY